MALGAATDLPSWSKSRHNGEPDAQVTNGRRKVGKCWKVCIPWSCLSRGCPCEIKRAKHHHQFTISAPLLCPGHDHPLLLLAERGARHHHNHTTRPFTLGDVKVLPQDFAGGCRAGGKDDFRDWHELGRLKATALGPFLDILRKRFPHPSRFECGPGKEMA
jgi:hypothetical protein